MKDLQSFTQHLVNPKLRKMRYEAYAVVARYPVKFPRVKNACIKWAWRMKPTNLWCQVPPTIKDRLDPGGKYSMTKLMVEIEEAMRYLSDCASTVVEDAMKRTLWIAEVDICLMQQVFTVPKTEPGLSVSDQEIELRKACAKLIADKLVGLVKLGGGTEVRLDEVLKLNGSEHNSLLHACEALLSSSKEACRPTESQSSVGEKLLPKVHKLNNEGLPTTAQSISQQSTPPLNEVIPWLSWNNGQLKNHEIAMAKAVLISSISILNGQIGTPHIAMLRDTKSKEIYFKTTRPINASGLMIPLMFKTHGNMFADGERMAFNHHTQ